MFKYTVYICVVRAQFRPYGPHKQMTRRSMMFISADCNLTFVRARVLNDRTNVEAGVGVGVNVCLHVFVCVYFLCVDSMSVNTRTPELHKRCTLRCSTTTTTTPTWPRQHDNARRNDGARKLTNFHNVHTTYNYDRSANQIGLVSAINSVHF